MFTKDLIYTSNKQIIHWKTLTKYDDSDDSYGSVCEK